MRLKPGAKAFLTIAIIVLILAGAYRMGWLNPLLNIVAPDRKPGGEVTHDMFPSGAQGDNGSQAGGQATDAGGGTAQNINLPPVTPSELTRPIRVGIVQYGGFAGGLVANDGTAPNPQSVFTSKHGVEVEFVQIDDLVQMASAFNVGGDNGGLDMMATTVDMFALQYDALKDVHPVTFLQTDWSRGADAIAVRAGINSAEDLKGKTVAVAEATPSQFLLLYVLSQSGLSNNDIKPVYTNSAIEAADIFKAGNADACVSWSPFVYFAADEVPGASILASTLDATNLLAGTMVVRGDFAARHPEAVTNFLRGWFEGVDLVNADMESAAMVLLNSFGGLTMDDAMGMLYDVKLAGAAENRQLFELDGDALVGYDDLWTSASKIWITIGKLEHATRPDLTRQTRFVQEATAAIAGEVEPPTQEFVFEEPTPETQEAPGIVTKRMSVYFATGSAELDKNAKIVLEQAAELAQTFGSSYIRVSGNTDSTGARQMNIDLSKRRAQAVVDYMIKNYSFPPDKFIVEGNGPDKPVATNDTPEGREQNRRTDFEVIPQQ
ncbi:OmpA family protein [bacterium]|nr:OmpA family protein [bacterium]